MRSQGRPEVHPLKISQSEELPQCPPQIATYILLPQPPQTALCTRLLSSAAEILPFIFPAVCSAQTTTATAFDTIPAPKTRRGVEPERSVHPVSRSLRSSKSLAWRAATQVGQFPSRVDSFGSTRCSCALSRRGPRQTHEFVGLAVWGHVSARGHHVGNAPLAETRGLRNAVLQKRGVL